jgi:hypothetical protein
MLKIKKGKEDRKKKKNKKTWLATWKGTVVISTYIK